MVGCAVGTLVESGVIAHFAFDKRDGLFGLGVEHVLGVLAHHDVVLVFKIYYRRGDRVALEIA